MSKAIEIVKDAVTRTLVLKECSSGDEAYFEELRERLEDLKISQEPKEPATQEQLKSLFLQTVNAATYHSGVNANILEEAADIAREMHLGGKAGEAILYRFPLHREVSNLRRVPPEMKRRHPKLTIAMLPSFFNATNLHIDFRDFTSGLPGRETLDFSHPLANVAEIELAWPDPTKLISARVEYEIEKGVVIPPHVDRQPPGGWDVMTVPQAKMLSRMLPR